MVGSDTIIMTKHCLIWNATISQNVRGEDYATQLPDIIAKIYGGKLMSEILNMRSKNPISFEKAIHLLHVKIQNARKANKLGYQKDEYHWYFHNFVQVISDLGFHIELSGEEFEIPVGIPKDC